MNILLGVSGSIAAYKSYDIARGLIKEGHDVRVILTKGAQEFVSTKVFQYLGVKYCYTHHHDFEPVPGQSAVLHIDLVKWADRLAVAPASANTLAKFAAGLCDDLLSSVFLALGNKPCIIFPAMNSKMLTHPATQRNINFLESMQHTYLHPSAHGELACGDIGPGKLPSVEEVITLIALIYFSPIKNENLEKRKILITTGATVAPLDPVRYLTNPSSGLTGLEIAKAFIANGDEVTILHGPNVIKEFEYLCDIPNVKMIKVHTTLQMLEQAKKHFPQVDVYISAAAICDIEFKSSEKKLKKSKLENSLAIQKSPDVLGSVLKIKNKDQIVISFAAETDTSSSVFLEKWQRKPVNLLVGNQVHSGHSNQDFQSNQEINKKGFGANDNLYFFIQEGSIIDQKDLTKQQLAMSLVNFSNTGMI
jgi:phosphopantothenoylcysteine decarboxylase/phosphopantothenate--cysteine ligase